MAQVVLAVDDDPVTLELIRVILQLKGYEVITARDSYEATKKYRENNPALVILDVQMPAGGGPEIYGRFRLLPSDRLKPIIFVSGMPDAVVMLEQYCIENYRFVPKPIDPDELSAAVAEMLSSKDPSAEQQTSKPGGL